MVYFPLCVLVAFLILFCLSLKEQAAGVYHRESRKGRYQLTYREAKAVCKYEGGKLATYEQLEAARQIGLQLTRKPVMLNACQKDLDIVRHNSWSHCL